MVQVPFLVVHLDTLTSDQLAWLRDLARPFPLEISAPCTSDVAELDQLLPQADGLIMQHRPATEAIMAASPRLRLIQKMGGRRDGIDLAAARARSIAVALMPMAGSIAVAEHAMALMLACAKKIVLAHDLTVTGAYRSLGIEPKLTTERSHGFQWMKIPDLEELYELTLGIFGFGDIGNEIAIRARAFGMHVIYHKRQPLDADLEAELGVAYAGKEDLLRRSDFVVMTSPLTPETEKTIGASELALMKPTAYLINVSRGGVIDEAALVEALRNHRITGAGLDVFVQEPIPFDHPYLELENVTLTPHIAGGKGGARSRQMLAVLDNIKRFADGQPPKYQIA